MSRMTDSNALLPCGTRSARLRHLARVEQCTLCGVDGSVPASMWRLRIAAGNTIAVVDA